MKNLTIKDFVEKKLAVTFDSLGEYKKFIKLCNDNNLEGSEYLSLSNYSRVDIGIILTCGYRVSKPNDLTFWHDIDSYNRGDKGWKLTPAKLFLNKTKETKIDVFQSGKAVIALKKVGGKVVAKGVAKCCPEDTFDFDYGAKLALDRLYGNTICKVTHNPIIRKQGGYSVGDKVVIVNDLTSLDHGDVTYRNKQQLQGKTVTISKVLHGNGRYELKEDVEKVVWFNDEFVGKIV